MNNTIKELKNSPTHGLWQNTFNHIVQPIVTKISSTVTVIGVIVTVASLMVSIWVNYYIISKVSKYAQYWDFNNDELTRFVSYVVMASCSLIFLFTRNHKVFRVAMGIKFGFFILYIMTIKSLVDTDYYTIAILLAEIVIYEAFWINVIVASAVGLTWVIIPLVGHGPSWKLIAPRLVVHCLVVIPLAILVYYRERFIQQNEKLRQMDQVVSRLTQTNLGYQTYAQEAAARSEIDERLRITRELHDIIGYTFTNNIMMMEAAYAKIQKEPDRVANLITLARENATEGLGMIRKTLYQLRETEPVRPISLVRFLHMIELFEVATQVKVETELGGPIGLLPVPVEDFMFYFIQAGLTNAFLHGGASKIIIRLSKSDKSYYASIQDNGSGAKTIKEGIGITGMRERLAALGGTLEVMNNELGFIIQSEIPFNEAI